MMSGGVSILCVSKGSLEGSLLCFSGGSSLRFLFGGGGGGCSSGPGILISGW